MKGVTADRHDSLRIWLRLWSCTHLIEGHVRRRLSESFATSLARFDLMAQLERAPLGLKMNELSRRLMVTGGNVTGITDGLEQEGLVAREPDPRDRRAYRVTLTRAGRARFGRMAAAHEGWIVELLDGLPAREQQALGRLLAALKQHVGARLERGRV